MASSQDENTITQNSTTEHLHRILCHTLGPLACRKALFWNGSWHAAINAASVFVGDRPDPTSRILYQRLQLVI